MTQRVILTTPSLLTMWLTPFHGKVESVFCFMMSGWALILEDVTWLSRPDETWNVITVLLGCYEILSEHGHETATKKLKLAHTGTSYQEVTWTSSSQQPDWGRQQKPVSTMGTSSSWSDPSHGVPTTRPQPHAFTAEAQSSESRHEPSLPQGPNFWNTDCEDSKVLVYATEVQAWLLGGHSYGHCLLSELQIVRKQGGSNHNPSAPRRWIPCHEKYLLQTVGVLFPCSLIESLASAQKPPHNSVFLSGDLGLISLKIFLSFISSPFLIF